MASSATFLRRLMTQGVTRTVAGKTGSKILRVFDHLLVFSKADIGLLPVSPMSFRTPAPPELPMKNSGAYSVDLYFKNLLHGFFDLRLSGIRSHFKNHGVLRLFHAQTLFRDNGPADHFVDV